MATTISREKLYAEVWSRPMTAVAREYGVTSTALKKTCDRHQIPTSERGYWARLKHGKPVQKRPLPQLKDLRLANVRIVGRSSRRIPEVTKKAEEEVRTRLGWAAHHSRNDRPEPPILAATRKAIVKARPDSQGFVTVRGPGVVPAKIAPASMDRALKFLNRLLDLAESLGHRPKATDVGLALQVEDEAIDFGLEEPSNKSPHQPTPAELRTKADHERWGIGFLTPWPKYDHAPSSRLALVIHSNPYGGLRRTFGDRKSRKLEALLPEVLGGFAEHAALLTQRKREEEERQRQWNEAEARRTREEAFCAREKRRMLFVEAIHEQIVLRAKLSAVLDHLERGPNTDAARVKDLMGWLRARIWQLDALISPLFLDISARFAKVEFDETRIDPKAESAWSYYPNAVELQFWAIDEKEGLARSRTAREWALEMGEASESTKADAEPTDPPSNSTDDT